MIINITQVEVIAKEEIIYSTHMQQLIGLMLKTRAACKEKGYIFPLPKESRIRIHTYFMRFPITLIFLDSNKEVLEVAHLQPWKQYMPARPYKWLIEIEKTSEKKEIYPGDIITF